MSINLLRLNNLTPYPHAKSKAKRCGRGLGSGRGKTSGRGMNGQKSKEKVPSLFEGGQKKLYLKKPKRGMTSSGFYKKNFEIKASHISKMLKFLRNNKISKINKESLNKMFGNFDFKIIYNQKFQNFNLQDIQFNDIRFSERAKAQFVGLGASVI